MLKPSDCASTSKSCSFSTKGGEVYDLDAGRVTGGVSLSKTAATGSFGDSSGPSPGDIVVVIGTRQAVK